MTCHSVDDRLTIVMPAKPILMWLIDDSEGNHITALSTVATLPWVTLEQFYTGAEAIKTFAQIEENQ